MIAVIAAMANGAVRLSIELRLVCFINVFRKKYANGHHKEESVTKTLSLNKQLGGCRHFGFFSKCCSLVSPLLGDVEKPQEL